MLRRAAPISLTASLLTATAAALGCLLSASEVTAAPPGNTLFVGAASRSLLPLVGGSLAYLQAGFPSRSDPYDPGILVPAWDDGRIAVGNGDSFSAWVHDDLRVTALAIEDLRSNDLVVIVATDLYMIFRIDADEIRAKVAAQLGPGLAKRTRILVSATHNHHGPDTAFDVNHSWYEHMTDKVAAAVVAALKARQPARLLVAAGQHWFGMNDSTDPQIFDPRLNVLQAVDARDKVIATAVQWNNHPEGTLGFGPPQSVIADDCAVLGLVGGDCSAEGRYFTSDYAGVLRQDLVTRYGGEALYLNGALGVLIGPGGAQVWEVTPQHPLGNQLVAPSGAQAAGGGSDYTARNFRRTAVVGEQLALAAGRLLDGAASLSDSRISYAVRPFFTRLSNLGFRILLVVDPNTGFTQLGHNVPPIYTCQLGVAPSEATCTPDGNASAEDPLLGLPFRVGDHLRSAVEYVRIGPVGMMFLPGEIPGELTAGLPAGFRSQPGNWYEEPLGLHAFGADYTIPGYTTRRMSDAYRWTIGLGSDELGYFIPISNFRVLCVADLFFGPGACADLHAAGAIEFPDSVAGATCKAITDDPSLLSNYPEPARSAVAASCRYGQALGEALGHYEETNAAGWDMAQDMMKAVAAITGNADATEVNPDFPGWWQGFLPPGALP
jgi:hypothetical protein